MSKTDNIIYSFLITLTLFCLFVGSIFLLNKLSLGYSYFSMIYFIFLILIYLVHKIEVALILNYIFSFVTLIMLIFGRKGNVVDVFYVLFLFGFSWFLLWIFNKYFKKEEILKHRLDQAFAETDSKKNSMFQELEKKKKLINILQNNLDRYYRLSTTINFFTDTFDENKENITNIENILIDNLQKFFLNSNIRIIHSQTTATDNIFMDWVRKQKTPLFLEDSTKDYRFSSDIASKFNFKSLILIPVIVDEDIHCFLEISNALPEYFVQEDMRLALIFTDIVSLSLTAEFLMDKKKKLVRIDPLTNIYNRRAVFELLVEELNRSLRYKTDISLLMIDIDFFKDYNDKYGHLHGDEVLKSVVQSMKLKIRDIDIIGRYGGEEFIVVLPIKGELAYKKAEELRITIENQTNVTVSIGVVNLKKKTSLTEFLDMADKALYKAKISGRNQVVCYN